MTAYELTDTILTFLAGAVGLVMLGLAIRQLRHLVAQVKAAVDANAISRTSALIDLESSIAERRLRLSESGIRLAELGRRGAAGEIVGTEVQIETLRFNEAKQMYLNALDRLCHCASHGVLNELELRPEYRDVIASAVRDFESDFGAASPFRNIKQIHDRWANQ